MKRRILTLILVLLVCLSGCQDNGQEDKHTEPTLPTIDETSTPKSQLQSAIDALKGKQFTASCGMGWKKDFRLTATKNMEDLRKLVPNENFLEDFCNLGLMVIPSNKGTFCYQLTELTVEQVCRLLCDRSMTAEEQEKLNGYPEAEGTVEIYVDAKGAFQSMKVTISLPEDAWLLEIQIK